MTMLESTIKAYADRTHDELDRAIDQLQAALAISERRINRCFDRVLVPADTDEPEFQTCETRKIDPMLLARLRVDSAEVAHG